MDAYERGGRYEGGRDIRGMDDASRGRADAAARSRWGPAGERRPQPDDYPTKRRRY